MRICLIGAVTLVCTAGLLAQTKPAPKTDNKKLLMLSGCVQRGEAAPEFTLIELENGASYRLTGMNLKEYLGRPVEVVGGTAPSKRLLVSGGLTPSANAAGQAGAIDPARAANAAASAPGGPGAVQLPELRVKSVRPVSGTCPG